VVRIGSKLAKNGRTVFEVDESTEFPYTLCIARSSIISPMARRGARNGGQDGF
jgi:hypothetical protein